MCVHGGSSSRSSHQSERGAQTVNNRLAIFPVFFSVTRSDRFQSALGFLFPFTIFFFQ